MSEENYIDKLYKDSFKSYEIQPKKQLDLTAHVKEQVQTVPKKSLGKLMAKKWLLALIAIGAFIAVILFSVSEETPSLQENKVILPAPDEKVIIAPVSVEDSASSPLVVPVQKDEPEINTSSPIKEISRKMKKEDSAVVPKPVIIHKTIIKRDTVIEHKQVIKKVPPTHEE